MLEMAAILITTIVTKRFIKFSKFNEEMLEVSGEFFRIAILLHVKYFKQICIISSGVVVGGRRPLFDFYKSMLISIYHKKVIFRAYSLS